MDITIAENKTGTMSYFSNVKDVQTKPDGWISFKGQQISDIFPIFSTLFKREQYFEIKGEVVALRSDVLKQAIVDSDKVCIKILDDLKKELCGVVDDENVKNYIENRIDGLILRIK